MSLPRRSFEAQRVAVIGGASGIGAAVARKAAEAGAAIIAVGCQQRDIDGGALFA
jgi:NAD(P)-dependent dehydrogenase (short-subunit alcohol dehydrogenase family)